jgi:hypothetical protein
VRLLLECDSWGTIFLLPRQISPAALASYWNATDRALFIAPRNQGPLIRSTIASKNSAPLDAASRSRAGTLSPHIWGLVIKHRFRRAEFRINGALTDAPSMRKGGQPALNNRENFEVRLRECP